jgi:pimeloyl-ACP methyl ester carboxylesterase
MPFVNIGQNRIEYEHIQAGPGGRPTIVMLHEGLGSVAMWKSFPQELAQATEHDVIVYSRAGYGRSSPVREARSVRYMHDEALSSLPRLLDELEIRRPILLGHSDGASIALIHAGGHNRPVAGLILFAPHIMVEEISIQSIAAAKVAYETTDLGAKLARYHSDVDSAFWGWNRIWLHPDFRGWNIEECLPRIQCPILAVQGELDEYGTMEQVDRIARVAPAVQLLKLPGCRHSPHRDCPEQVLASIVTFVAQLAASPHPRGILPVA